MQTDIDLPRQEALGVLAGAKMKDLSAAWDTWANRPDVETIRGPETGLIMLRGRTGGGGAPFNLGGATVSRASVRIASGEVGHGYCLGRDEDKARLIAVIDARVAVLATREGDRFEGQWSTAPAFVAGTVLAFEQLRGGR